MALKALISIYLPIIIALTIIYISWSFLSKSKSILLLLLFIVIICLNSLCICLLILMFLGIEPSNAPYIGIAFTLPILAAQIYFVKKYAPSPK